MHLHFILFDKKAESLDSCPRDAKSLLNPFLFGLSAFVFVIPNITILHIRFALLPQIILFYFFEDSSNQIGNVNNAYPNSHEKYNLKRSYSYQNGKKN